MSSILEIRSIEAIPDFSYTLTLASAVDNRSNFLAGHPHQLWPATDSNGEYRDLDGDDVLGSQHPVVFKTAAGANQMFSMKISAACEFPESWRGRKFRLVATANEEGPARNLTSEDISVPEAGNEFTVQNMELGLGVDLTACSVPVGINVNFSWRVELVPSEVGISDVEPIIEYRTESNEGIRLELYWAQGPAPNGPLLGDIESGILPRVKLPQGYPIALLRFFALSPSELPSILPPREELLDRYIDHVMDVIWKRENERPRSRKLRYDTYAGRPQFNMTAKGGNFNLDAWTRKTEDRLNCFDLAGITQLALDIVVDDQGNDVFDARYISQERHGLIKPGPLYGWLSKNSDQMRCNNPMWDNDFCDYSPYLDPEDERRTGFSQHVWIEVERHGKVVILDNTRRLKDNEKATLGTLTREEYLAHGLDIEIRQRVFQQAGGSPSTRHEKVGDCWMNPISTQQRLGVTGATGEPNFVRPQDMTLPPIDAKFLHLLRDAKIKSLYTTKSPSADDRHGHTALGQVISPRPSAPLFPKLDLDQFIARGATHPVPPSNMNTKSVDSGHLFQEGIFPENEPDMAPTVMTRIHGAPVLVAHTSIMYYPAGPVDTIVVTIDSFGSLTDEGPYTTLKHHIEQFYEVGALGLIKQCSSPLGAFSFETDNEVFWLRGNLFLTMRVTKGGASESEAWEMMFRAAQRLDSYLASGKPASKGPSRPGGASVHIHSSRCHCNGTDFEGEQEDLNVFVGESFLLVVSFDPKTKASISPQLAAQSTNGDVALAIRAVFDPPFDTQLASAYEYLVTGPGATTISLFASSAETMVPVVWTVTFIVVASEESP